MGFMQLSTTLSSSTSLSRHFAAIRADAPLHVAVAVYYLLVFGLAQLLGKPEKFTPLGLVAVAMLWVAAAVVIVFAGVWLVRSLQALRSTTREVLQPSVFESLRPQTAAGLCLFFSMCVFVSAFTGAKSMLTDIVPFYADPFFMELDVALHGGHAWLLTNALIPRAILGPFEGFYFVGWSSALMASILAAVLLTRFEHVRSQFVWTYLIVWPLFGNVIAAAGMSGGPIFYDLITGDTKTFAEQMAYLSHLPDHVTGREIGWSAHMGNMPGSGIAISAFPSLHVAMATLVALLSYHAGRWCFLVGLVFAAAILIGSVQFGWHYAVDGYFSIVATVVIWKVVGAALKRKSLRAEGYRLQNSTRVNVLSQKYNS